MRQLIKIASIVIAVPAALAVAALIFLLLRGTLGSGTVISGSMVRPDGTGIPVGSLLMGWKADAGQIKVGDIVIGTDPTDSHKVSHRVVSVSPDGATFKMQGDHNNLADAANYPASKAWIVFSVTPGLGGLYNLVATSPFIAPAGYAAAGILAWVCFLQALLNWAGRAITWPGRRLADRTTTTPCTPARREPRHSAGLALEVQP